MSDLDKVRDSLEWDKRMYKMGMKGYEEREEVKYPDIGAIVTVTLIIGIVLGMILMEYLIPWIMSFT